jgi:hypothetical protein
VLGEAAHFLRENPGLTAPALIDLLNLYQHRRRSPGVRRFRLDEVAGESWKPLFEFLYRVCAGHLTGAENIPNDSRALLVANHWACCRDGAMVVPRASTRRAARPACSSSTCSRRCRFAALAQAPG